MNKIVRINLLITHSLDASKIPAPIVLLKERKNPIITTPKAKTNHIFLENAKHKTTGTSTI